MSDLVERWPGYNEQSWAQRFAELDRQFSKERDTAVKAICQLSSQTSARITELETSLAEAEGRVKDQIVNAIKTHQNFGDEDFGPGLDLAIDIATALETGEWKK